MSIQDIVAVSQPRSDLSTLSSRTTSTLSISDVNLLEGLCLGQQEAFEELVNRFQTMIYNLAYRLLNNVEDARDITQEIFLKIYKSASSFRGDSELKTWIYRVTINQISNQQRWWKRRKWQDVISLETTKTANGLTLEAQLASDEIDPEERVLQLERQGQLMKALSVMKFEFRVVVILRDVNGLGYEEIAKTLDISVGTVKSRIARGREDLRCRLKG